MSRSVIAVALLGCGLAIGCNADKPPAVVNPPATSAIATAPSASASTASTSTTPPVAEDAGPMISVNGEAADAIKRLISPTQAVRDGAAVGDPGEAFWNAKLAAIKPGISIQDLETATGGQRRGHTRRQRRLVDDVPTRSLIPRMRTVDQFCRPRATRSAVSSSRARPT